ncbi:MAG: DNA recombination/repair protein RecA, partial [Clostridia bacterium]|nr:DNA recombination/repair protein RecA [Clostridia bacterium]
MAEKNDKVKSKAECLQDALAQIEKQFGKGSIMLLGEESVQKVEAISTGCLT